jgi:hypothetical protein
MPATYYAMGSLTPDTIFVVDGADPPRLYADTDRDGDLAEEEPLTGKRISEGPRTPGPPGYAYGPIALSGGVEVVAELAEFGGGRHYLTVRPAGLHSGRIELDGAAYAAAVVDANMNGRCDDACAPQRGLRCDWLAVDTNRNGRFEGSPGRPGEVLPLPGLLEVGGTYYAVSVAADGSSLSMTPTEPEFGTLDLGGADAEVQLLSSNGLFRLGPGGGPHRLPAGRYRAIRLILRRRDGGAEWTLSSSYPEGALSGFAIEPGATTTIEAGEPLVGRVTAQPRGPSVEIEFGVFGQAGEDYEAGARKNGRRQPAPKFRIVGESGEVAASGSFRYG